MANPEIPEREVYGTAACDILRYRSVYDTIDRYLDGVNPSAVMTLIGANLKRDDDGDLIDSENDDTAYEITDTVILKIDVREWCHENDAMELLEDVEFAETENA